MIIVENFHDPPSRVRGFTSYSPQMLSLILKLESRSPLFYKENHQLSVSFIANAMYKYICDNIDTAGDKVEAIFQKFLEINH